MSVISIELFNFYIPKCAIICRRCSFNKADRIKLLNYTNKALFGPVIKKETTGRKTLPDKIPGKKYYKRAIIRTKFEPQDSASSNSSKAKYSSEMFWLLGNKWSQVVGPATAEIKTSPKHQVLNNNQDGTSETESKESCDNKTESYVNSSSTYKKSIPFSNEELKNILMYPLIMKEVIPYRNKNVPSVGKILQSTMPEAVRIALLSWKVAKILEIGEKGFADLQKYISPVHKLWESVSGVLSTFSASPVLVETPVFHPTLKYRGICDCVSSIGNELTLIEWKKSGKSKPTLDSTYDAPLQLCAYLGALHSMPEFNGRIRQGMIVVAYENGQPADVYKLNEIMLRKYWRAWLGRLHEFWIRSRDDTLLEPI